MAKQDRTRKSSPQNKVKSFLNNAEDLKPSLSLDAVELARFRDIIDSRELDTWSPADIATATHLAQVEIERDTVRDGYLETGHTISDHNGKPIINPLFTAYNILDTQTGRLRRDLGLSASQRAISGHKQSKRNKQDRLTADKVSSLSGFINRP